MWCKTQAVVALSSAEAELYGLVRASAETMGLVSMYTHMNGVVLGDASAALAIVARRGLGKLRHLDTNYLWIQEKVAKGEMNFKKVAGVDNGAHKHENPVVASIAPRFFDFFHLFLSRLGEEGATPWRPLLRGYQGSGDVDASSLMHT